ncbi:uncharacterized protein LOC131027081 isoform X2 [Cryptomeria japonica]|uniref:uncharacterized protein LOC131027081 isoform X2 n=1 Tax=Cryptomeria japonica TaxID=3369 RepID=UPI0025AD5B65|nr:uncharacterized protein LOC131027081 isoform X2 [Cryptomeria japonica]
MQNTAMQCISWQRFTQYPIYRNPFHSITTLSLPLETSFLKSTSLNGTKLKALLHGFSLDGLRIAESCIERKGRLVAVTSSLDGETILTSSRTKARERRMEKLKEERKRREFEKEKKKNEYPQWAKILEDGCKHDAELNEIIGDAIGNPELMRERILKRGRRKGSDIQKSASGSVLAMNVSFRDFNPTDSYIWIELYGVPSDKHIDFIGNTIRSWYVLGRLGGFNSTNMQLTQLGITAKLRYNEDQASKALTSSLHDISDVEFQDNLARFWIDMGTSDVLALDILINSLIGLSAE